MVSDLSILDLLCAHDYVIIENFLAIEAYQALIDLSKRLYEQDLFIKAGIGQDLQKQVNHRIRKDEIYWLDAHSPFPEIHVFLNQMQSLMHLFNEQLFLSLIGFESHFAIYEPGSFYKRHSDQFQSASDRQLSCVYYMNENWQQADGGELLLYDDAGAQKARICPKGNRLLCFKSHLEHEVLVTNRQRISITSWLKSRASLPMASANKEYTLLL